LAEREDYADPPGFRLSLSLGPLHYRFASVHCSNLLPANLSNLFSGSNPLTYCQSNFK